MTSSPGPVEVLGVPACLTLLAAARLGRVAVVADGVPAVFPVHFRLLGRDPVFLTGATSRLAVDGDGRPVCLEVDEADPENHAGWSVLVSGVGAVVRDPVELDEVSQLPLRPWVGAGDVYVRIAASSITGRRVAAHLPAATGRERGY